MKLTKKCIIQTILTLTIIIMGGAVSAQSFDIFGGFSGSKKTPGKKKGPTIIEADKMDVDRNANLITFTGNVYIDDDNLTITSEKLVIHLVSKEKKAKNQTDNSSATKSVEKAVFTGNVVIIRKLVTAEDKKNGRQKATADKLVYGVNDGRIILTGHPVLIRGNSRLLAEKKIIFYRNTEKITTEGRTKIISVPNEN
jgi:lipopolysaccharide transport protein LptA